MLLQNPTEGFLLKWGLEDTPKAEKELRRACPEFGQRESASPPKNDTFTLHVSVQCYTPCRPSRAALGVATEQVKCGRTRFLRRRRKKKKYVKYLITNFYIDYMLK